MKLNSLKIWMLSAVLAVSALAAKPQSDHVKTEKQAADAKQTPKIHETNWLHFVGPDTEARTMAEKVEALAAEGRWKEARNGIPDGKQFCRSSLLVGSQRICKAIIASTQGYVDLKEADSLPLESQEGRTLLSEANTAFSEAITLDPSNGPTLANLAAVYVRLGNSDDAITTLEKAIVADRGRTEFYASQIGQLQIENQEWGPAIHSFARAAETASDSYESVRRIVQIYTSHFDALDGADQRKFFGYLANSEQAAPDLARSGYEFLFRHATIENGDGRQALLAWAKLLARDGALTKTVIQEIPDHEKNSGLTSLSQYLDRPWSMPNPNNWWLVGESRRTALAYVALYWGRTNQDRMTPEIVDQCWTNGLRILPRGSEEGALRQIPDAQQIALDLRQELVLLYDRVPALDSGGTQARGLVGQLFFEKMESISRHDLEAQQRYHTVLGQIFAAKGVWHSNDAANAFYQLKHALKVAEARYEGGETPGFYQPLPEVHALLADGYQKNSMVDEASIEAVRAALAYFDSDNLDRAQEWITRAEQFKAPAKTVATLRELLDLRRNAAKGSALSGGRPEISKEKFPWLFTESGLLDDSFLRRQMFKLLADISHPAPSDESSDWSASPPVNAYSLVVQGKGIPLVGAQDLKRWQKVKAIVINLMGDESSPPQLLVAWNSSDWTTTYVPVHEPLKDHMVYVTLPGELEPEKVVVTASEVTAANVTNAFGALRFQRYHTFLRLAANQVLVSPDAPMDELSPLLDRLRVVGVSVKVPPGGV